MRHISNSHTSSEQPDKVSNLDVKKTLIYLAVFKDCNNNFTKKISRENITHATQNNNYHSNTRSSSFLGYFPSCFRPVGLRPPRTSAMSEAAQCSVAKIGIEIRDPGACAVATSLRGPKP